ncbi:Transcription termination factor Rho [Patescibacteria group bacterium]|nr:transcription termination factor Rho [Candidatus Dojkabacteria bacterium]CAG1022944.1 Transcription termination factor Rho [Patescibacteria group bacterium]
MTTVVKKETVQKKDSIAKSTSIKDLEDMTLAELRKIATELEIKDNQELKKNELVLIILAEQTKRGGNIFAEGFLEVVKDTHGVLRSATMLPADNDVYVSGSQIKRFNLRQGDFISGQARPPKEGERYLSLLKIEAINGTSPEKAISRPTFQKLTPVYPDSQIKLATEQHILSTRLIDLISPIGKGQRGMIVAPPKAGKTWLMKDIADGIAKNHPEIHLMVVLVGERPEEVTDMQRFVKGEVIAANFDEPPEFHTKIAEMAVERAKRLVEYGKDVVILMDSITRLARAYNIVAPPSGRTLSGGFDPVAIFPPKKFFGAARNMENGGSLTIIATALVDTGSKMDDVIFEEFKGTGNMEVKLDRRLTERRIFPAIDVTSSYTRNEDKLLSPEVLAQTWRVIRMLDTIQSETNANPTEVLLERLKKTKTNEEFLATLHESM